MTLHRFSCRIEHEEAEGLVEAESASDAAIAFIAGMSDLASGEDGEYFIVLVLDPATNVDLRFVVTRHVSFSAEPG